MNGPFIFAVASPKTWSMNAIEGGSDLALIQTSLPFPFECKLLGIKQLDLHIKSSEVCIKTRSPAASLPFKAKVTEQTTVK